MAPSDPDRLFDGSGPVSDFEFNEGVAAVFDDMVRRSVPYYQEIQEMVVDLAARFARPGTRIVDLGCSTGTTLALLGRRIPDPSVALVGVDNAPPMLDRARERLAGENLLARTELRCQDVCGPVDLAGASVVLMNWTMQFVRPPERDAVVARIAAGLSGGGCFIMSEKVVVRSPVLNRLYIDLYHRFKQRNGYTEQEIARKREALENVLVPYRVEENLQMLLRNGFDAADVFFRWFNFACFVAVRGALP